MTDAITQEIEKNAFAISVSVVFGTLNQVRALKSLVSHVFFAIAVICLLVSNVDSLRAQYALPANGVASPPAPPIVTAPTGVYVQTNVDPITGRQVDIYLEQEAVTVLKWEQQEVTERRYVPQWVHETQKITEVQYIPSVTYQTQARNLNAWNPLLPPRIAYEYTPVTQYQTVNQVVDKPITYQKYVDQETKVIVPKLVQVTEQRAKYTQRERNAMVGNITASQAALQPNTALSGQPDLSTEQKSAQQSLASRNTLGTDYVTRPLQGGGSVAGGSGTYPYASYASQPTTASMTVPPTNPYSVPAVNPYQTQQPNFGSYPYQNPTTAYSWWQTPSWMTGTGPLLSQNLMGSSGYSTYNPASSMMTPGYSPQYQPYQPGTVATIGPSTAPVSASSGYYSNRDSMQAGLPPSVLR